jgi:hypothetical protein
VDCVAPLRSKVVEVGSEDGEPYACTSNPSCLRGREIGGKEERGR